VSERAAWTEQIGDVRLLVLALVLSGLGLAMIFSAGQVDVPSVATGIWRRQLLWLALALAGFVGISRVPLRWLEWAAPGAYALALGLLVLVLVVGTGPGGTKSWLALGPARLQPAEFAKLATILLLARILSSGGGVSEGLSALWKPVLVVLVPLALVLVQPDLGSAIIFGVILIAALYWAGVSLATLFLLVSPGISLLLGFSALVWGAWIVVLAGFLYIHRPYLGESLGVLGLNVATGALTLPLWSELAPYQQDRLLVFLNPGADPRGSGWHLVQSKVAIGSGGLLGQGYLEGPQKRLAFLPEQHTDFIFSVVGEELGFVGAVAFMALLIWFLSRVLRAARAAPEDFGGILAFSLFGVWFAHVLINIGMTVGLMPITGLPLPFLSYGGSFLVSVWAGLAMVERVAAES
jgi:rod shape determining protein RodA